MQSTSFDESAKTYDEQFSKSIIGRHQRDRVWGYLETKVLGPSIKSILELNCGTGEDAVFFAEKGFNVIATDQSDGMLQVANEKVKQNDLSGKIKLMKLDLSKPEKFKLNYKVDLIFSNFGGLNCIDADQLKVLSNCIQSWLSPNGKMIFVIMPKSSLLERWYCNYKGLKDRKEKRKKGKDWVQIEGGKIMTYFYNHEEIEKIFKEYKVIDKRMVSIMPSYLNNFMNKYPRIFNWIVNYEKRKTSTIKWLDRSDHYLLELKNES